MSRCRGVAFVAWVVLASACFQPRETNQPTALPDEPSPAVFRSTLDGRSRVLTARLADDVWAAYDVSQAAFFKLWRDGVDFEGPVYDGRHGPQPRTRGNAWMVARHPIPWRVHLGANTDGESRVVRPKVRYRGHAIQDGELVLRYSLDPASGDGAASVDVIEVSERVRAIRAADDTPGFERRFALSGPSDSLVSLEIALGRLDPARDVETDGRFMPRPNATGAEGGGRLQLRADAPTTFVVWLRDPPAIEAAAPDAIEEPPGQVGVAQNDCGVCHGVDRGTVGPGFRDIAARYASEPADVTASRLATKIVEGGTGVWGDVAMTPHPDLPRPAAEEMAGWILSLEGGTAPEDGPLPSRGFFSGWGDFFAGVGRALSPGNEPGDGLPLAGVHPSFDLETIRPPGFAPRVGGLDFLSDGRLVVASWDPHGGVYLVEGLEAAGQGGPLRARRIAAGLAEPLGLHVVDDEIYVLQKPELTKLIDRDGDDVIDAYRTVSQAWTATPNFHEFAFGLAYRDGDFYATLATAILPGGASAPNQAKDRGRVVRIPRDGGPVSFPAHGLRTPNGIGFGPRGLLYVTDNQGDWLPSSKLLALAPDGPNRFFGSRSVGGDAVAQLPVTPPVVWLPQGEIGNSPSEPVPIDIGPWAGQLLVADVTHGGLKRVFVEEVAGVLQGAVFRFSQGFEAGLNRAVWGPDGQLYVGGIGSNGNWGQADKERYGLQRLRWNGTSTFEMLAVRALPGGLEVVFSEAVAGSIAPGDVEVQDWRYEPTAEYGGPKVDLRELDVEGVSRSPDGLRLRLAIPGLGAGRVVYLRLSRDAFESETGASLWSTEAWVTLNAVPLEPPNPNPSRSTR